MKEGEGREITDFNAEHIGNGTQTFRYTYIHTYIPVIGIDISTLWTCDQSLVPRMGQSNSPWQEASKRSSAGWRGHSRFGLPTKDTRLIFSPRAENSFLCPEQLH